jgi:hypothetical protein
VGRHDAEDPAAAADDGSRAAEVDEHIAGRGRVNRHLIVHRGGRILL